MVCGRRVWLHMFAHARVARALRTAAARRRALALSCSRALDARRSALGAWRSALGARRSALGGQILLISFGCFVIEMCGLYIAQKKYRTSFFFAMDVLGTLSILLDVTMVARATLHIGDATGTDGSVLRAARLAKIGAKSGRLAKLVRLFRLLFNKKDKEAQTDLKGADMVSVQLSKLLAQRVAALVMIIIVAMPMLTFTPTDLSPNSFVETINYLASDGVYRNASQWDALVAECGDELPRGERRRPLLRSGSEKGSFCAMSSLGTTASTTRARCTPRSRTSSRSASRSRSPAGSAAEAPAPRATTSGTRASRPTTRPTAG